MTWNVNHKGEVPEGSPWTEERTERLRELWIAGLSCSQIATELGTGLTRNAIIGKVHRIRLHRSHPRGASIRGPMPPRKRAGTTSRRRSEPRFLAAPPPPADAWEALPGTAPVGLLELTDRTCRWPLGEKPFRFCGCPTVHGSVYCGTHTALGTKPIQEVGTRGVMRHNPKGGFHRLPLRELEQA